MKIGELVKRSGLSKDTIRYYEKMGLLKEVTRPFEYNDYKDYPEQNLERLKWIGWMKEHGFTLNECRNLMEVMEQGSDHDEQAIQDLLDEKIRAVEEKLRQLEKIKETLLTSRNVTCEEIKKNKDQTDKLSLEAISG